MVINEIFYSLQGEGLLAGVPSIFIRLAGCPLRCTWCDTKYAWDPAAGDDLSIPEILDRVDLIKPSPPESLKKNIVNSAASAARPELVEGVSAVKESCKFIVITGGEPMVNPQLPQLAAELKKLRTHVTIETAGIEFVLALPCDLMSISPKTSNSGQENLSTEAVKRLIEHYPYQLKFVVDSADDLPEIRQAIKSLGQVAPERVMLMPQAMTRKELLAKSPIVAELCKSTGYVFCQRLQILLYDGARGK